MQTLLPQPASATARPIGRAGRWWRFGMTPLAMGLFAAGFLMAVPAFRHPQAIWFVPAWDGLLLLIWIVEAVRLPAPERLTVTRAFLDSPQLGQDTRVELTVRLEADSVLDLRCVDDLHAALVGKPREQRLPLYPREDVASVTTVWPRERGDHALGRVYLRYRAGYRGALAERWCAALPVNAPGAGARTEAPLHAAEPVKTSRGRALRRSGSVVLACAAVLTGFLRVRHAWVEGLVMTGLVAAAVCLWMWDRRARKAEAAAVAQAYARQASRAQRVRVFPALEEARDRTQFFLQRARQIAQEKRRLRLRGVGRDFESLRDYQPGDELRNVSWTATARRGKPVTRQFTVERSQQVWVVLDAGRLSGTALELKRGGGEFVAETEAERDRAHRLTVTQLDQAATAAAMLAQVIDQSGDKVGMMAYGRGIQQLLPAGQGAGHLRMMIDLLSRTRSERAEADHLQAMARLRNVQRRRGLIVWVTEMADQAGRPEIVAAAAELVRQHLVVLVLLKHPELETMAARVPTTRDEMYVSAAAQEMLERRRETVALLERQGVLIVETSAEEAGVNAIGKYLQVKAEGRL